MSLPPPLSQAFILLSQRGVTLKLRVDKNFYLNADPQKMSCAKDSENKGKRMAQVHSHPGMPSAGARVSQPYYIQGGILTQRCSEAKLSKVREPGRWSRSGREKELLGGCGGMGGGPERESLRSG